MSQLLSEAYRLLKIKPIRTTPYHPQTDGLVERFNGTLKAMLKKAASEDGRDWDPAATIPPVCIPRGTPGFHGIFSLRAAVRAQRQGTPDILKESWEADKRSTESVVSYVLTIQERLAQLRDIVHDNLQNAQANHKQWYDRHARNRQFQPETRY